PGEGHLPAVPPPGGDDRGGLDAAGGGGQPAAPGVAGLQVQRSATSTYRAHPRVQDLHRQSDDRQPPGAARQAGDVVRGPGGGVPERDHGGPGQRRRGRVRGRQEHHADDDAGGDERDGAGDHGDGGGRRGGVGGAEGAGGDGVRGGVAGERG